MGSLQLVIERSVYVRRRSSSSSSTGHPVRAKLALSSRRTTCQLNYSHADIKHTSTNSQQWRLQAAAADGAFGDEWAEQPSSSAAADAEVPKGAAMPATVFNLVNVIMGAGYVSIPFACR
jgi:hypothetical protein